MSVDRYPILVERLTKKQALVVICNSCEMERTIDAADIRNEMDYVCSGCGGWAVYCCSRACKLQTEYAKTLAERAA